MYLVHALLSLGKRYMYTCMYLVKVYGMATTSMSCFAYVHAWQVDVSCCMVLCI